MSLRPSTHGPVSAPSGNEITKHPPHCTTPVPSLLEEDVVVAGSLAEFSDIKPICGSEAGITTVEEQGTDILPVAE